MATMSRSIAKPLYFIVMAGTFCWFSRIASMHPTAFVDLHPRKPVPINIKRDLDIL